eukprot:scaffold932_cov97-Isochrysis_galbana.AAC.2
MVQSVPAAPVPASFACLPGKKLSDFVSMCAVTRIGVMYDDKRRAHAHTRPCSARLAEPRGRGADG